MARRSSYRLMLALPVLVGPVLAGPVLAGLIGVASAYAQDAAAPSAGERAAAVTIAPLPADSRSSHTLELAGRTLRFTATAGSIPITDPNGAVLADIAFVAYELDGAERRTRPVTFAFNGGPGAASTWLQLGGLGPWRVPLTVETIRTRDSPALLDNADTWLDFTDLVFIDPPGTGFSRVWPSKKANANSVTATQATAPLPTGGDRRRRDIERAAQEGGPAWFWSTRGDIVTFATFIKAWMKRAERESSPLVLAGESYGGFRAPHIATELKSEHALTVRAMVLISPVLDFDGRRGGHLPQHYVALLPSIAATRMERSGVVPARAALTDAETYARGDYLIDLMRGPRDREAGARMAERVSQLAGLDRGRVRALDGRLSARGFVSEAAGFGEKAVSLYDAGVAGMDVAGDGARAGFGDPFTAGLTRPLTAAMGSLYARLGWPAGRPFALQSSEANRNWIWRSSPHSPEALGALESLHRSDERLVTLVAHGFSDLVTPYFATALQLDQLAAHGPQQRIRLEVYPGGHMLYSRDPSRARLRADAEALIGEAVQPRVR